jgi:hypothetical protein
LELNERLRKETKKRERERERELRNKWESQGED